MEKKEFLSICDSALKEMGFSKKGGVYYLNIGSDLVGAVPPLNATTSFAI